MNQMMDVTLNVNIASGEFKANPFPFYAHLRATAPVYRAVLPHVVWLVTRYDDVVALLKDERFVKDKRNAPGRGWAAKQPWIADTLTPGMFKTLARNMLDLDPPDHTRLRGLVHKVFTPRMIEQMRERVLRLSDKLLDAAEAKGSLELIADYALPLPSTIIAEMLGVPVEDHPKFNKWSGSIVSASSGSDALWALPSIWQFVRYIRRLLAERRAHPQDDLLTGLVQAEEAGDKLSEDELVAMVFILLVAGHETTVNLIASGTLALLEHPDQMMKLRDDPTLIKTAVEELLRFTSPVERATERYAREDVTLHGVTIPQGDMVLGAIASANRDENVFAMPDVLDITRTDNKHLAFGQGIHYCVGAPLARLEGQIAINNLLRRMPDLRLKVAPDMLRWRKGLVLRGLEALPLAF